MNHFETDELIGKTVSSAKVNASKNLIELVTDSGTYFLSWVGECCAVCFLAHVNFSDALIGSKILDIQNTEWKKLGTNSYETDQFMGTTVTTTKGVVSFETRLEHNGYYSGEILITKDIPAGQYRRSIENTTDRPLEDF